MKKISLMVLIILFLSDVRAQDEEVYFCNEVNAYAATKEIGPGKLELLKFKIMIDKNKLKFGSKDSTIIFFDEKEQTLFISHFILGSFINVIAECDKF